jgi:hypothetical protein
MLALPCCATTTNGVVLIIFRGNLAIKRSSTTTESPSLAGAWRGVWPILSLLLFPDRSGSRVTIFWASLVLAAAYRIVCFTLPLRSDVYPLFNITAIPRYQICRPCPSMVICNGVFPLSPAHYAAHLIFLFLFFAPYHINNVSLSTARCRGLRPDIFAYLIFLRSGIEWWLSILTGHINVCSNAN